MKHRLEDAKEENQSKTKRNKCNSNVGTKRNKKKPAKFERNACTIGGFWERGRRRKEKTF